MRTSLLVPVSLWCAACTTKEAPPEKPVPAPAQAPALPAASAAAPPAPVPLALLAPLTADVLDGPYPSLLAACEASGKRLALDGETRPVCAFTGDVPIVAGDSVVQGETALPASGALVEARVLPIAQFVISQGMSISTSVHLGIKTSAGWYLSGPRATVFNPSTFGAFGSLRVQQLAYQDVLAGGEKELVFSFTNAREDSNPGENELSREETSGTVLCGLGASGRPSCTEAITTAYQAERSAIDATKPVGAPHHAPSKHRWSFALSYTDGMIRAGAPTRDTTGSVPPHSPIPEEVARAVHERTLYLP